MEERMHLLHDAWIPVVRKSGHRSRIRPAEIGDTEDPVWRLDTPRPDFEGAMAQFLIGLLQTTLAPEDDEDWADMLQSPPSVAELDQAFTRVKEAFFLTGKHAFLQDYDLDEGDKRGVAALLIDSPGEKTIRENLDHFVKRDRVQAICPACAAQALFTLQTNAPSGGSGHRTGMRGGGPLTTLILPGKEDAPLWELLWLNVLDQDSFQASFSLSFKDVKAPKNGDSTVFPWMRPTLTSEKKTGVAWPQERHALEFYWGMPRRIRLGEACEIAGCDLCGEDSGIGFTDYITKNYGLNYEAGWHHPLTPLRPPGKEKPPLPVKGQQGGVGYADWLGLCLEDSRTGMVAARVVAEFIKNRAGKDGVHKVLRLWCFGYDMDNMKARCWYDQVLPPVDLPEQMEKEAQADLSLFLERARDAATLLRKEVTAAGYGDPRMAGEQFWKETETAFYALLPYVLNREADLGETVATWRKNVAGTATRIFDTTTLSHSGTDLMKIMKARKRFLKKLWGPKFWQELKQLQENRTGGGKT